MLGMLVPESDFHHSMGGKLETEGWGWPIDKLFGKRSSLEMEKREKYEKLELPSYPWSHLGWFKVTELTVSGTCTCHTVLPLLTFVYLAFISLKQENIHIFRSQWGKNIMFLARIWSDNGVNGRCWEKMRWCVDQMAKAFWQSSIRRKLRSSWKERWMETGFIHVWDICGSCRSKTCETCEGKQFCSWVFSHGGMSWLFFLHSPDCLAS